MTGLARASAPTQAKSHIGQLGTLTWAVLRELVLEARAPCSWARASAPSPLCGPCLPEAAVRTEKGRAGCCCLGHRESTPPRPACPSPRGDHRDLGVRADGLAAFHTGVGTELVKAFQAAVVAVLLHILLSLQVVPAVVAVKLLSHGAHLVAGRTCEASRQNK